MLHIMRAISGLYLKAYLVLDRKVRVVLVVSHQSKDSSLEESLPTLFE